MAEETILKKEFKQSDVERVRNIVRKDFGAKTKDQVGYRKASKKRKEGEVWEENGKTWVIKNGIRERISGLEKVKKEVRIPLTCPRCGKPMHHHLSKKMYKIHGFCFDCTVEYEATLRKAGLYEEYSKKLMQGNMQSFLVNLSDWLEDHLQKKDDYVTEEGDLEEWENNNSHKERLVANVKKFKNEVEKHLT